MILDYRPNGPTTWLVTHNDDSDHGRAEVIFDEEDAARQYVEEVVAAGPQGDEFHPAPATLNLRAYQVISLEAPEEWSVAEGAATK